MSSPVPVEYWRGEREDIIYDILLSFIEYTCIDAYTLTHVHVWTHSFIHIQIDETCIFSPILAVLCYCCFLVF